MSPSSAWMQPAALGKLNNNVALLGCLVLEIALQTFHKAYAWVFHLLPRDFLKCAV